MIYVYRNETGEKREISASMKNPPADRVLFRNETEWEPAPEGVESGVWTRVYGDFEIDTKKWSSKGYNVGRIDVPKGLPGCDVDHHGRTIIRNKQHEIELCKRHNLYRHED